MKLNKFNVPLKPEHDVLVSLAKKPNAILENVKKRAEQNHKPEIPLSEKEGFIKLNLVL